MDNVIVKMDIRGFLRFPEQAIKAMKLDKNTSGDYSMYQKGIMMGLSHQYADEINQMDALIKAYPGSDFAPQAMLEKGNAQALLGKNGDALDTYAKLLKDYPKSVEARKGLLQTALVTKSMGKEDAPIDPYKKAILRAWDYMEKLDLITADDAIDINDHINTSIYKEALDQCNEKYGSHPGPLQEKEGPPLARELLTRVGGFTEEEIRRVCALVGEHHTVDPIDGIDHQILVEADYLVNSFSHHHDRHTLEHIVTHVFATDTGRQIYSAMFGLE